MHTNLKDSALDMLGDISLKPHFCLFYETEPDLLESLAVYFKTGLANHELCLWITSDPLKKSKRALTEFVPSAEQLLTRGQIEILSSKQWYLEGGVFNAARLTRNLEAKIKQALDNGYSKLRAFADAAWMNDRIWKAFFDYEASLDGRFANQPVSILCAYPASSWHAAQILDVARTHRFVAAKRNGIWEILEAPELKHRKAESKFKDSEYRLQAAIDAANIGIWTLDMDSSRIVSSGYHDAIFGFAPGEFDGSLASLEKRIHPDDLAELKRLVELARERGSEYSHEYRVVWPDGSLHWVQGRGKFVQDDLDRSMKMVGAVLDITERKRAEESIRKSERVLREAELLGHTGSWEQDLITGEIFNSQANHRLFFGDDQSKGADLEDYFKVVHPDDRSYVIERRNQLLAGGPPDIEYRVIWPDGGVHVIYGLATVVRDSSGRAVRVYGTNVEITERRQMEAALRESETKLKQAQELVRIGYWERDLIADRITPSEETRKIFGREKPFVNQAELEAMIHPDDRQLQQEALNGALQGERRYDVEYRILRPDGNIRFVHVRDDIEYDENGTPIRLFGTVQDVTERMHAEEARRRAEELFRAVVEDQTEMIVRWKPDGIRTFVNQAYCRTFGQSYAELVGTSFWPLVAEPYRQSELERIRRLTPDSPFSSAVHESLLPDGTTQWQEWRDRGFFDEQGNLVELQSVGRDITERRRAEEQVRQHATRMETLAEISRTFAEAGLDYQGVLDTVVRRVAELTDGSCVMTLFTEDAQRSFPVAYHHPDPKARAMMQEALFHTWQGGTDTERYQSLLSGNSIFIPVVDPEEFRASLEPDFHDYFDRIGISGTIIVPLRIQGRVIGTLGITRDRNGSPYTRDDELLLRDLADRAALTIENARLFEQVQGAHQRLQTLSSQLLIAQEDERRTLARELHDDVGQRLTGLMMQLGMAKSRLPKSAKSVREILEQAETLIQDILQGARSIVAGLRPQALDDLGLVPALRRLVDEFSQDTGTKVEVITTQLPERLPASLEIALFRIAQEALTNVRKHALADGVKVMLVREDSRVVLSVQDNGRGFEKQADQPGASGDILLEGGWRIPAGHFGLIGIQERAAQLGGKLDITSVPGQGTTLRVELPLSEQKAVTNEQV